MKKTTALIFTIISLIIGIYTLIDVIRSLWYVLAYESVNASSSGMIFGKFLFFVVISTLFLFSLKVYRKSKN
ncbi:hypothetical protein J2X14_001779 [Pantoea alhagi]|nr:hypothetical protein [Pantoea alhagi]